MALLIAAAVAALAAFTGVAAAAGPLDQSQTALDHTMGNGLLTTSGEAYVQTFTAGRTGILDQVSLALRANPFPGGPLVVEILPAPGGVPGSAPLAVTTVDASLAPLWGVFGGNPWVAVPIPDTLVSRGSQYAVALQPVFSAWQWQGAAAPLYGAGQALWSSGLTGPWSAFQFDYSFGFETFVVPCLSGPVPGGVKLGSGQSACLAGAQVSGPVTVGSGGSLLARNSTINGPLRVNAPSAVHVCGSQVLGPLSVDASSGPVVVGDGGTCAGNTIGGPVTLTGDTGGVSLVGNTLGGPVTLSGDDGGETVGGNSIAGPLRCNGDLTAPDDGGQPNTVGGPKTGDCAGL